MCKQVVYARYAFISGGCRFGRSRHRDNEGTAAHRCRPAGPSPQGARGPLRADGRAGDRAIPAGEQILLRGEGVREVFLPLHQPRLGALRLLHRPRLRLPRRAHEARPPPPRVSPLPHPRHRALHEGRARQDDHGRGRRSLRTHGLLLRIRVRKKDKGTVQDALLNRPSYAQVAPLKSDGSERKEHRA